MGWADSQNVGAAAGFPFWGRRECRGCRWWPGDWLGASGGGEGGRVQLEETQGLGSWRWEWGAHVERWGPVWCRKIDGGMEIGNSGAESWVNLAKCIERTEKVSLGSTTTSERIDSQCVGRAIMVREKGSAAGPISRWFFTATQNADSSRSRLSFVALRESGSTGRRWPRRDSHGENGPRVRNPKMDGHLIFVSRFLMINYYHLDRRRRQFVSRGRGSDIKTFDTPFFMLWHRVVRRETDCMHAFARFSLSFLTLICSQETAERSNSTSPYGKRHLAIT